MNFKYIFILILLIFEFTAASGISAQISDGKLTIQYPIKELGNCQNQSACKIYCDKPDNLESCVAFAEKNKLMSDREIQTAKRFISAGKKGPGGCRSKNECENYCNDMARIDECLNFAEKNDLMTRADLEEAKKVQAAIKRGIKPPPCNNKKQCDAYCEDPKHMEECIVFGVEAGFLQGQAVEDAKKMLTAIKKGLKPLACRGREECDVYCQNPDNIEECINFAEVAGFMDANEAAMARKTKGRGPGNCKSKETCKEFCNNPVNQEICFNFAKEHGLLSEEELQEIEEGREEFIETLEDMPSDVLECVVNKVGAGQIEKIKNGAAAPPRDLRDKIESCFAIFEENYEELSPDEEDERRTQNKSFHEEFEEESDFDEEPIEFDKELDNEELEEWPSSRKTSPLGDIVASSMLFLKSTLKSISSFFTALLGI